MSFLFPDASGASIFMASPSSPHFPAALALFKSFSKEHAGRARFVSYFSGASPPAWPTGKLKENFLLTRLAGTPVYSDSSGVLLACANGISGPQASKYGEKTNSSLAAGAAPHVYSEEEDVRGSCAVFRLAEALCRHAGVGKVVCEGSDLFGAAARLRSEHGAKTVFFLHENNLNSSSASLAAGHADGVIASDGRALSHLLRSHSQALGDRATGCRSLVEGMSLLRERRSLARIACDPSAPVEERRTSISLMKHSDASLAFLGLRHGVFHAACKSFALLPHALPQRPDGGVARSELLAGRKKLFSSRTLDGGALSGKKVVFASLASRESAGQFVKALPFLGDSVAMAASLASSGDTEFVLSRAFELGVANRLALVSQPALAELLACSAIALPDSHPEGVSCALRATSLASSMGLKDGPVTLIGMGGFSHAMAGNSLLSPSLSAGETAALLSASVANEGFRKKLAHSAEMASASDWGEEERNKEFNTFLAGI